MCIQIYRKCFPNLIISNISFWKKTTIVKTEELVTTMALVMFKKPTHRNLESTGEAVPQDLVPRVVLGRRGHGVGRRQGLRWETTKPYSGRNWDQERIDISTHVEYFFEPHPSSKQRF